MNLGAQIGGNSTLASLQLTTSPIATSLGGSAFSLTNGDIGIAVENPALIDSTIDRQLAFNNAFYIASSNYGAFMYGHTFKRAGSFTGALKYISFGKFDGRDVSGVSTGEFRAGDYTFSVGYGNNFKSFRYGVNAKLFYSHLEEYHSLGFAFDASIAYHNPEKNLILSILGANIGAQLKAYNGNNREKIPMNISIGFSKRFKNLPFRLNIIAHNLQEPILSYEFENEEEDAFGFDNGNTEATVLDKVFRHLIFGGEIFIAKVLIVRAGYNHLRRKDAGLESKKGLAGISLGAGIHIKQFKIDYGFAKYHQAANNHHVGITVNLNEFGTK